jgi:subtilisin family serine protease
VAGRDFSAGTVLIKLRPEVQVLGVGPREHGPNPVAKLTDRPDLNRLLAAHGIIDLEAVVPGVRPGLQKQALALQEERGLFRWYRARSHQPVEPILEKLANQPGVEAAEPDYLRKLAYSNSPVATGDQPGLRNAPGAAPEEPTGEEILLPRTRPNGWRKMSDPPNTPPHAGSDPLFAQQWHLSAARVVEAWGYLRSLGLPPGGSRYVVVAVIDSGVDLNHPDLAANLWANSREIPGNGVDDDGNGYVDDVHGIDAITRSGNPMDDHGHGTHVAGIIAAQGHNQAGGVGVAYNVQIMPLKAAQYSGVLTSSDIARAIHYAVAQGADVINMSFGGYVRSQIEEDALAVAFGQCVLVAAAGNDNIPNEEMPCKGKPMYPAAYNWVLGVMASTAAGHRASFSNWDCAPRNSLEYELMAPGVDVMSTLPNGQYAAWDGTSMAAPVVSGIAALVRTRFPDKDLHSSRFVMGQIAANAAPAAGEDPATRPVADALAALSVTPKPELSYLEHWLFDTIVQGESNDADGIVDAGETIELAIVIRNHWGKADQVIATLEAQAEGAVQPDPYVTWDIATVDYGAVGSFNTDDNGLVYDAEQTITGVQHPFRFRVSPDCPNDHVIPFRLRLSCRNGLDPTDATAYAFAPRFYLIVQRGRELPRIISTDMTLTKDYYWLVADATLIEAGVTVTVTEGTQVQFCSAQSSNPYTIGERPYLQVEGTFNVQGTQEEPAELFPSGLLPLVLAEIYATGSGKVQLSYARLRNPWISGGTTFDHCHFSLDGDPEHGLYSFRQGWHPGPELRAQRFLRSVFHKLDNWDKFRLEDPTSQWATCLLDSCNFRANGLYKLHDNVFLKNHRLKGSQWGNRTYLSSVVGELGTTQDESLPAPPSVTRDNAFLNVWWDPDPSHWLRFYARDDRRIRHYITDNFWGTTSRTLIDAAIIDYQDNFNKGQFVYEPILTEPPTTCYPFVADVRISAGGQETLTKVGAESILFRVIFNRDMDRSVQPQVSFGPDIPYTDYTARKVEGGWADARTWVGSFNVTPVTGDGYQYIRVAGAVAADDPWLVTGDDSERFRFEIITSGTESMNLQATGGEAKVSLSWMQDDFEMLAGYNLYRSTNPASGFTRLNSAIIPAAQKTWQDTAVIPGQPYYYKFTVVKTDMTESDFSNVTTGTPLDTIPPVIVHRPVVSAAPGLPLTLFADVTDNVGVQTATLQFRVLGETVYASRPMTRTTGNRFSATLEGSHVTLAGLEYYLEASDGVSTARFGRAELPFQVRVENRPVVTSISPVRGPASANTSVVISGANFQAGARVRFNSTPAGNVIVESVHRITCQAPAHFPATVDVTVENADGSQGALLRGYTYYSDTAMLNLPNTGGRPQTLVQVPVNLANVSGLAAADLTIAYSSVVLQVRQVGLGSLTPGWSLQANTATPGQIRLSMSAQAGPVEGSGVLAWIEFEVVGSAGSSCPLPITAAVLNDGAISVQLEDGFFLADSVYHLEGAVRFWQGARPLANASLTAQGEREYRSLTSADGTYRLQGIPRGAYSVKPAKLDQATEITAYDAALVLQHAVGLTTLTGYAAQAADVNKNGVINAMDAYFILQKSVGLIEGPFPGAGVVWEFVPGERTYPDLVTSQAGQDFTALLLGDVSGNWSTAGAPKPPLARLGRRLADPPNSVLISTDSVSNPLTGATEVAVRLSSGAPVVYGLDLRLDYEASAAQAEEVAPGAGTAEATVVVNTTRVGQIHAGVASAAPLPAEAIILELKLTGSADADVRIGSAAADEGGVLTTIASRQFHLAAAVGVVGGLVTLPIEFIAQGNENALGFSLRFDPLLLNFAEALTGPGANGASLQFNDQEAGEGRVGVALTLSPGSTFPAGWRTLAMVSFRVAATASAGWTAVRFADQPVRCEISDAQGIALGVNTAATGVALVAGYEGDVAPRTAPNGLVTVTDWVQVGRFAAALDAATDGTEFQRADCAPRLSEGTLVGGDGRITVSDWVQAGRYAAGLDPATPMMGPTLPAHAALGGTPSVPSSGLEAAQVMLGSVVGASGQEVDVPVTVHSSAWVAGLGLSLSHDIRQVRFLSAEVAPAQEGLTLLVNDAAASSGRVGLALAGMGTRRVATHPAVCLHLRFRLLPEASGRVHLSVVDQPIPLEAVDALGRHLPVEFRDGEIRVTAEVPTAAGQRLSVAQENGLVTLSWPVGLEEGVIEWTASLTSPEWRPVQEGVVRMPGRLLLRVAPLEAQRFYRVHREAAGK